MRLARSAEPIATPDSSQTAAPLNGTATTAWNSDELAGRRQFYIAGRMPPVPSGTKIMGNIGEPIKSGGLCAIAACVIILCGLGPLQGKNPAF
jgi:hypothetical protein